MAICSQCGVTEANVGLLCSKCVAENKARREQGATVIFTEPDRSSSWANLLDSKTLMYGALGLVALFYMFRSSGAFGFGVLPPVVAPGSSNNYDSCSGKRRCLVVVLAPWCPSCEASIPFVKSVGSFVQKNSDLGLQVVTGLDDAPKLQSLASEIGMNARPDPYNKVYNALGGGGVPRWGIIDRDRKIINRGSGLPGGISEDNPLFKNYLHSELGLL